MAGVNEDAVKLRPMHEIIAAVALATDKPVLAGISRPEWIRLLAWARAGLDADRRNTELLEHNNALLERSRKAEREVKGVRQIAGSLAIVLQKMIELKGDWSPPA